MGYPIQEVYDIKKKNVFYPINLAALESKTHNQLIYASEALIPFVTIQRNANHIYAILQND